MGVLMWDKPKKAETTEKHNERWSSDSLVPGTYVPNMSREDMLRWKAKLVGVRSGPLRVEIRKTFTEYGGGTQALFIVYEDGSMKMSANGTIHMTASEYALLLSAIAEAKVSMKNIPLPEKGDNDGDETVQDG